MQNREVYIYYIYFSFLIVAVLVAPMFLHLFLEYSGCLGDVFNVMLE